MLKLLNSTGICLNKSLTVSQDIELNISFLESSVCAIKFFIIVLLLYNLNTLKGLQNQLDQQLYQSLSTIYLDKIRRLIIQDYLQFLHLYSIQ